MLSADAAGRSGHDFEAFQTVLMRCGAFHSCVESCTPAATFRRLLLVVPRSRVHVDRVVERAGRMFGILGLGFLLGMQHALEADHIAAVSSIAARRTHIGDIVKHGLTWGLGHTLTLFAVAGAAILVGHAIPDSLARPIETAVGIML